MTRLNLVEPEHLTKRHLVAEYKEITQFLHIVKKRALSKHPNHDLPEKYTLNTGHCKFFFNKGEYIASRFEALRVEMIKRGVTVDKIKFAKRYANILESYTKSTFNDWKPNSRDYTVVIERIAQRINEKPHLYPDKDIFFNSIKTYI